MKQCLMSHSRLKIYHAESISFTVHKPTSVLLLLFLFNQNCLKWPTIHPSTEVQRYCRWVSSPFFSGIPNIRFVWHFDLIRMKTMELIAFYCSCWNWKFTQSESGLWCGLIRNNLTDLIPNRGDQATTYSTQFYVLSIVCYAAALGNIYHEST